MKHLRPTLLPLALLLSLAACDKEEDKDKEPSKTDLLTANAWKDGEETLQLNGNTGRRTPSAASTNTYQFGRDGKLTITAPDGTTSTASWAFAGNETQLTITRNGGSNTFDMVELSNNRLAYGFRYNQAQVQQALSGGANAQLLTLLLLSAGYYTFPAGTPSIPTPQLTSVHWTTTAVPK